MFKFFHPFESFQWRLVFSGLYVTVYIFVSNFLFDHSHIEGKKRQR